MTDRTREMALSVLLEASITDLTNSSNRAFPSRSDDASNVRIVKRQYSKYDSDKLLLTATCGGETDNYETSIMFEGVQFTDPNNAESITVGGISILPIGNDVQVKVRCNCLDYYWTFAWQNSGENALIGDPPPPYQNYSGQRNPTNAIGMCKHLFKLRSDIETEGLLR
jgi:hypothetical protein